MSPKSVSEAIRTETFDGDKPGDLVVNRVQDCEPARNEMRELKTWGHAGWSKSRDLKLHMKIPLIWIEKWSLDDGVNYLQLDKREFAQRCERKIAENDLEDFLMSGRPSGRIFLS